MERKTNIWIIENIKPEWTLESRVPKAALSYVARENERSEKERKPKTKMAGHTHGVLERSNHQQHETRRQR